MENYYAFLDSIFNLTPWAEINNSIGVFLIALLFSFVSKALTKFEPKDEFEKVASEIKRISELSRDALDVKDYKMYAILQKQGNELIHQYYLLIARSAVLSVTPHLVGICLTQIGLKGKPVFVLPFNILFLGKTVGGVVFYIICAIAIHKILFKLIDKLREGKISVNS